MNQITWTLTAQEAQYILNLLGRCPYGEVKELAESLLMQANSQSNAKKPEPPGAGHTPDDFQLN